MQAGSPGAARKARHTCRNRRRREPHRDRVSANMPGCFVGAAALIGNPRREEGGFPWHLQNSCNASGHEGDKTHCGRRVSMKYLDYGEDGRGVSNRKPPCVQSAFAPGPERNTIISAPGEARTVAVGGEECWSGGRIIQRREAHSVPTQVPSTWPAALTFGRRAFQATEAIAHRQSHRARRG